MRKTKKGTKKLLKAYKDLTKKEIYIKSLKPKTMSLLTPEYCLKTFGDPYKAEAKHCVVWNAPKDIPATCMPAIPRRIYMHKKMVPYWNAVYRELCDKKLGNLVKVWNGCFNIRLITGSKVKWSLHAYGLAVDFNAHENPFGSKKGKMDMRIVKIFEDNGFEWGGRWKKIPDFMHYQMTLEAIAPVSDTILLSTKSKKTTSNPKC